MIAEDLCNLYMVLLCGEVDTDVSNMVLELRNGGTTPIRA